MRVHRLVAALTAGALLTITPPALADEPLHSREEAAAAPAVVPEHLTRASRTIRDRVLDHVAANGTTHEFSVYRDLDAGTVVVGTNAPADVLARLIDGHADVVRTVGQGVEETASRKSDSAPFYGGAGIRPSGGTDKCSTGFTVKNAAATRFMVTAGHCYPNGQVAVTENGGVTVGTVTNGTSTTHDMALLKNQSYAPRIYLGGVDSSTSAPVLSAMDPLMDVGGYCHSGRTTGEQCGHKVVDADAMACTKNGCKDHVVSFTLGVLPDLGDSGGPFFAKSGTNILIRGIVFGRNLTDMTGWVEPYSRIKAQLGVTVVSAS
ncbi:hypothetical protein SUDANB95_01949 [Actinosynnema sp. ALI-1.44]